MLIAELSDNILLNRQERQADNRRMMSQPKSKALTGAQTAAINNDEDLFGDDTSNSSDEFNGETKVDNYKS